MLGKKYVCVGGKDVRHDLTEDDDVRAMHHPKARSHLRKSSLDKSFYKRLSDKRLHCVPSALQVDHVQFNCLVEHSRRSSWAMLLIVFIIMMRCRAECGKWRADGRQATSSSKSRGQ